MGKVLMVGSREFAIKGSLYRDCQDCGMVDAEVDDDCVERVVPMFITDSGEVPGLNASTHFTQALGHTRLPARAGCLPPIDDVRRQSNREQLARIGRERPPALIDLGSGKHFFCEFRQLFILAFLHHMGIDTGQIRFQGAARCGFVRGHWLSSY
jgi:hypothetical protein